MNSGVFKATYITYKNFTICHTLASHKHFFSRNFVPSTLHLF